MDVELYGLYIYKIYVIILIISIYILYTLNVCFVLEPKLVNEARFDPRRRYVQLLEEQERTGKWRRHAF